MKIAIALFIFYFVHSLLASNKVKQVIQNHLIPIRWYRVCYNLIAMITLVPILWYFSKSDSNYLFELPKGFRFLCYLSFGLGFGLLIQSLRQYDLREFTGLSYFNENDKNSPPLILNTSGLNSRVRHPLYFATLILIWSFFLLFSAVVFLWMAVISTVYIWIGTRLEEQKLVLTFGNAYKQYQREVPMLFPNFWKN